MIADTFNSLYRHSSYGIYSHITLGYIIVKRIIEIRTIVMQGSK